VSEDNDKCVIVVLLLDKWNALVVEAVNASTLLFPRQARRSRMQRLRLNDIIVEIVISLVENGIFDYVVASYLFEDSKVVS
jgi:hypothetical protein